MRGCKPREEVSIIRGPEPIMIKSYIVLRYQKNNLLTNFVTSFRLDELIYKFYKKSLAGKKFSTEMCRDVLMF